MSTRGTLSTPGALDALCARLGALTPDSPRQWGRMTVHQMLCHLSDAFLIVSGDRPVAKRADTLLNRTLVKFVALKTPLPWPKGVPTMKECDAEKEGTPPEIFERDRAKAIACLRAFAKPSPTPLSHPLFGPMSHEDWMIWAFRHTDHHLRQFGQ
ncbi:MAG: DUF1569 domain-containing protein [Acidobacteria bacterium]|nr:MAG: DUF1569 domain-containing protein [Acidobacteriota bacterium]